MAYSLAFVIADFVIESKFSKTNEWSDPNDVLIYISAEIIVGTIVTAYGFYVKFTGYEAEERSYCINAIRSAWINIVVNILLIAYRSFILIKHFSNKF